ncbi:MAG: FkbM family methyltransferase [Raineya sp.]|nr:FkbM family methyltransferase [Raineya sp.]MDW8296368.1 FkbM family methyltransferase [Raineya sp.]
MNLPIIKKLLYEKAINRAFFTIWGIAIQEFKMSFTQFFTFRSPILSFLRVLKYLFLSLNRLSFGRSARLSYAFKGEDRLIESILKPRITKTGFYVEVGCNHPTFISNSFLFYRRGWRGICIDANERLIAKYQYQRPKDKAVCAFVSNSLLPVEFVEFTNDVLSSSDKAYIQQCLQQGNRIASKKIMQPRSLTEILDEQQCPKNFDFLSIDVEEHDYQVLLSLDLERYQPRLIIVEAEDFNPEKPEQHPIFNLLKSNNYRLEGYILTNLYFTKLNQQKEV